MNRLCPSTGDRQQHPLSAAFPGMTKAELDELTLDIREHGQLEDIVVFEGMVLDGWHRYLSCNAIGIEPRCIPLADGVDPVAYVQSKNLHRRHMTETQRTAAVVACSEWAPAHRPEKGATCHPSTVKEMAETAQTSERTVQRVKKGIEAGLGGAMRDGRVTANQAAELAKLPEPERQAALEAPPAAKGGRKPPPPGSNPAPEPPPPGSGSFLEQRVQELEAEVAGLKERLSEMAESLQEALDDNESMDRIVRADDRLQALMDEVKRFKELARVSVARVRGITSELNDVKHYARLWKKKFDALEKKVKGKSDTSTPDIARAS